MNFPPADFSDQNSSASSPSLPISPSVSASCASILLSSVSPISSSAVESARLANQLDQSIKQISVEILSDFTSLSRNSVPRLLNSHADVLEGIEILKLLGPNGAAHQRIDGILEKLKSIEEIQKKKSNKQ